MHTLKFRLAELKDIQELNQLINAAYRHDHVKSWTNESKLIAGDRIHEDELRQLINHHQTSQSQAQLLVAELNDQKADEMIGCIVLSYAQDYVEIGTFCIAAHCQNLGYGQQVLKAAEIYALKFQPTLACYHMWVLHVREELIGFYERRGYVLTGKTMAFPVNTQVGEPLVNVHLVELIKSIKSPQIEGF